jgi:hypothetical protein
MRPRAKETGSLAVIHPHIPLGKINESVFTAEQHLNQLKIFAKPGLADHRSLAAA